MPQVDTDCFALLEPKNPVSLLLLDGEKWDSAAALPPQPALAVKQPFSITRMPAFCSGNVATPWLWHCWEGGTFNPCICGGGSSFSFPPAVFMGWLPFPAGSRCLLLPQDGSSAQCHTAPLAAVSPALPGALGAECTRRAPEPSRADTALRMRPSRLQVSSRCPVFFHFPRISGFVGSKGSSPCP